MNRPEGISESAWDAASELLYAVDAMPSDGNITIIAKAIQSSVEAENEACAIEALRWQDGIDAAEHIRRRLRKGA